jgi:hypothetical protein
MNVLQNINVGPDKHKKPDERMPFSCSVGSAWWARSIDCQPSYVLASAIYLAMTTSTVIDVEQVSAYSHGMGCVSYVWCKHMYSSNS